MVNIIKKCENNIDYLSMKNEHLEIEVTNLGCTILKVFMKDKDGNIDDVVLCYDDIIHNGRTGTYFGALVGRIANRIKRGKFTLNDKEYTLAVNNGPNHLHGGIEGFSYKVFDYEIKDENTIEFKYLSKDNEEGYPGNLTLRAIYTLKEDTLSIRYLAECDQDTIINITNHSYFNLAGCKENIYNHVLELKADRFACVDNDGLPNGEIRCVENTPFDFRTPEYIGKRIDLEYDQLKAGSGFDHPFLFNVKENQAILTHEATGRRLTVSTTLPGAQIYTGNFLGGDAGKYGMKYERRMGVCIETQNLPDAIHLEENPSTILKKGETYDETTSYKFEVI